MHDTAQYTTRPTTVDDLDVYQRTGRQVAAISAPELFIRFPELGQVLLSAVQEAHRAGLTVDDDGVITLPLTEQELQDRLDSAQAQWDVVRGRYLQSVDDPGSIESYWRASVDRFAEKEGLDPITWDAVEESA